MREGVSPATEYVNGREKDDDRGNRTRARSRSLVGAAEWPQGEALASPAAPLVTTPISHHTLDVYPRSIRVSRPQTGNREAVPPDRSGSQITGFSSKSRSRLRFAAVNAFPAICSQLGLTYHNDWPTDGREAKRHLDAFCKALRRIVPAARVLWLLEFQRRNAPHFHLFLTVPPDRAAQVDLAKAWCRISGQGDDVKARKFHSHSRNWIPWDIMNGAYLCKYLDKEAQKSVPEGYVNFGRFWGHSSDLVPPPIKTPIEALAVYDQIDEQTGEVVTGEAYIIRNLGRLAERQTNGYSRFRKRAPRGSYMILNGTKALLQLEAYLGRSKSKLRREVILDDVPF